MEHGRGDSRTSGDFRVGDDGVRENTAVLLSEGSNERLGLVERQEILVRAEAPHRVSVQRSLGQGKGREDGKHSQESVLES